jgi:hypothetical protein
LGLSAAVLEHGSRQCVGCPIDDKDLAVDDVRVMCHFARQKLQPMFEDAMDAGYVLRTKQEVLYFITRDNMLKCRYEMIEKSGDPDLLH